MGEGKDLQETMKRPQKKREEVLSTHQDQSAEPRSEQYWSYKNVLATLPFLHPLNHNPTGVRSAVGVRDRGEEVLCAARKEKMAMSLFPPGGALCMVDLSSGREM